MGDCLPSGVRVQQKPKLLHSLRANLRLRHFSPRTEEAYVSWVRRFVRFHGLRHPGELGGERQVVSFLTYLTVERGVASSTQGQALAALLFLYRDVLGRPLEGLGTIPRARAPVRLPVVLTRREVQRVLAGLGGTVGMVGALLYGSGMRLMECLTLRVKDVDLERGVQDSPGQGCEKPCHGPGANGPGPCAEPGWEGSGEPRGPPGRAPRAGRVTGLGRGE